MKISIAKYIASRLSQLGIEHIFTVPGTSCSDFLNEILNNNILKVVTTSNEMEAGYAADAYANVKGLSAIVVSNGVGTLSLVNAIAGSFVERNRVILINGGLSESDISDEKSLGVLANHSIGHPRAELNIFSELTIESLLINSLEDVSSRLDHFFSKVISKNGPAYLEISRDLWKNECENDLSKKIKKKPDVPTDADSLNKCIKESLKKISNSKSPLVVAGVQLISSHLIEQFRLFLQESSFPFITTLKAKTILNESHEQSLGVYDSDLFSEKNNPAEKSDCLICLGPIFGIDHKYLVEKKYGQMICASEGEVRVGEKVYKDILLKDFLEKLTASIKELEYNYDNQFASKNERNITNFLEEDMALSFDSMFKIINSMVNNYDILTVVDTSFSSFPFADLKIHKPLSYFCQPVWLSIGYGLGASLGIYLAKERKILLIIGDGGFQNIAQGLSSLVKYNCEVVIVLIKNNLYGIEQYLIEPSFFESNESEPLSYNLLHDWDYKKFSESLGGKGFSVKKNSEFEYILRDCLSKNCSVSLIETNINMRELPSKS